MCQATRKNTSVQVYGDAVVPVAANESDEGKANNNCLFQSRASLKSTSRSDRSRYHMTHVPKVGSDIQR